MKTDTTARPANLTTLAKRNGTFPAAEIERVLKGTDPVRTHGTSPMLVWGALFLADANGNEGEAAARVKDVIAFLQSIQMK